jgi:hypothetical protein
LGRGLGFGVGAAIEWLRSVPCRRGALRP